jgi:hypothetical protein
VRPCTRFNRAHEKTIDQLAIACRVAYSMMMRFLPKPQPTSAMRDVLNAIRTPIPHKIGIAGVCAALTYALIAAFIHDFSPKPVPRKPTIVYVKLWPKNRTLAQIKAQQAHDAPLEAAERERDAKEIADADAKRRAAFERVHQSLKSYGID